MRIIAGTARGTALKTLPGTDVTRPTVARVKEGMFSAVQFLVPGARVLDAFAGSGQLGLEALSRGAASCVFLDESRAACAVVRENAAAARTMSVEEFRRRVVERIDATKLLKTEYLSVVHAETLEEIDTWSDSFPMRCCIAVQAGDIRLIDNIAIA